MKKNFGFILTLLLLISFIPMGAFAAQELTYNQIYEIGGDGRDDGSLPEQNELYFAEERVIVKLANTSRSRSMMPFSLQSLGVEVSETRLLNPSNEMPPAESNGVQSFRAADMTDTQNNVYVLTLEETGKDAVERALKILNANPAVEIAEPDYLYEVSATPNDPQYNAQYALEKIGAQQAWDITTGSKDVVVGVIDTGIEGTHPDLVDNLWTNPNPGQNGYKDDVHGYNFIGRVGGIPTDIHGHGTHVAGIIGAKGNNGQGVCGINWDVSLAWLGIDEGGGYLPTSAAIEALNYANNHEILITNNSYGGGGYSQIFEQTIKNYKGLFIVAAGNEASNNDVNPYYPASYNCPNIISVASSDDSDRLSYFSNYGENSVDIAAPGSSVLSTYLNGSYTKLSGTSMASPYVAGVAALIKSEHPEYTTAQIKTTLIEGADNVSDLFDRVLSGNRLDAYHALVPRPSVEGISITPDSLSLDIYEAGKLTVVPYPVEASKAVVWKSSDSDTVKIYPDGSVLALKSGSVIITAHSYTNPEKTASAAVTVTNTISGAIPFLDLSFKQAVIDELRGIDSSMYGSYSITSSIYAADARKVTRLGIEYSDVKNVEGLQYFTNLEYFYCSGNQIKSLDVSKNIKLKTLLCDSNQLTNLNVSGCTALKYLSCDENQLTSLDVSENTSLYSFSCSENQLTSMDVSKNSELTVFYCSVNQLTSLDVSKNSKLGWLYCSSNQLTNLNINGCNELIVLDCYSNLLVNLDVSKNTSLHGLYCYDNQLTSLDISSCTELTFLDCSVNRLMSLDVSKNTALISLSCSANPLTSLDVSSNTSLFELYCGSSQLTSLDVSKNTALRWLYCSYNQLSSLDVSNTSLLELYCEGNQLTSLNTGKNTSLLTLYCEYNRLTSLDVSKNTSLTGLYCGSNQLISLDVSKNTALRKLYCENNQLTSLDVSKNTILNWFYCNSNQLTNLDVSKNTILDFLSCHNNPFTDIKANIKGEDIHVTANGQGTVTLYYYSELNDFYTQANPANHFVCWTQSGDRIEALARYNLEEGQEYDLTAHFMEFFAIKFDSQGGSMVYPTFTAPEPALIQAPTPPVRTGYTFGGWYKETGCQNAWNFDVDKVTGDITLYAKWTMNRYTITATAGMGGSVTGSGEYTYDEDVTLTATPDIIDDVWYSFDGWYENDAKVLGAGTTYQFAATSDRTLEARFITHTATLTINKDDSGWDNHGKTFTLKLSGNESITRPLTGTGSTVTTTVINGTWKVYDGDTDTGTIITINSTGGSAALNYYSVSYSVSDVGMADGSVVSATYEGNSISNGAVVLGGKTLAVTATGVGAESYTYDWSGTASGTDMTYVTTITARVLALCTVTGSTPTQDYADISAAKLLIEGTSYGSVAQAFLNTQEEAKAYVENFINDLTLNGVITTVTDGTFSAATAGAGENINGTNGSYSFTVKLNKGVGTEQTTIPLTLGITATIHVHTYGEYITRTEPTCILLGQKYRVCSTCNYEDTKKMEALGHNFENDWTVDTQANCIEDGSKSRHCTRCDEKEAILVIPSTGHTFGAWETISSHSCTDSGEEKRVCSICDIEETRVVDPNGHIWESEYVVDKTPTCTEEGSRSIHCSACDAVKDSTVIPATGHSFSDWELISSPNCTDSGAEKRECSICGLVETRGIDPDGHTWESEYAVDKGSTCTEEGSESIHCSKCDAVKDSTSIPATGHAFGDWETVSSPNCTNSGEEKRVCSVCGFAETRVIVPNGHTWESEYAVDKTPTCTEKGSKSIHCSACDTVKDPTVIPATGHSFGDWEAITSPNCTNSGAEKRVCAICGFAETRDVDPDGHIWESEYAVDKMPTCTEEGSKSIHCSACDAVKDSTVIPSSGHTSGDWETISSHNCTDSGAEKRECSICGLVETRGIDPDGHTWESGYAVDKGSTCTEEGSESIHCSKCDAVKDSTSIPATGHAFGDWETVSSPNCTKSGEEKMKCSVCGFAETRVIVPNGHIWESEYAVDKTPTCTEEGSKSIHCSACDAVKDPTVIPATGHSFGDWEAITSPNCTNSGAEKRVCTICGFAETRDVDPDGHTWESEYAVDKTPTCTEEGSKSIHCSACDAVKESSVIPSSGHAFGTWETISFHNCIDSGEEKRECSICGFAETRDVDPDGHTWESEYAVDKGTTCTEEGSESIHCSKCDAIKDSTSIPAAGHIFGDWIVTISPTTTDEGTRSRVCGVCGTMETEKIECLIPTYGISLNKTGTHTFPVATYSYGAQTDMSVTISNTGDQATGVLKITISGKNATSFKLSKDTISTIAEGGTNSFIVVPQTGLAVGTYTATVTVSGDGNLTAQTFNVSFTVNRKSITVPKAKTGLVYNGKKQTGIAGDTGYTVKNGAKKNAGTYNAMVTLNSNYQWSSGANPTEARTVKFTIAKKQLVTPNKMKITRTKVSWQKITDNNGYMLKAMQGTKTIFTVQVKKNKTSYTFTKAQLKKFVKGKPYTFTLMAKGGGNYKDSKTAKSKATKMFR